MYQSAKTTQGLFSGETTYTWGASEADTLNLDDIINDFPPSEHGYAAFYLVITSGGNGTVITITGKNRLEQQGVSSASYGTSHSVLDDSNGNTVADTAGNVFEANLYAQAWAKMNNGIRIILTRNASTAIGLKAVAVSF